MTKINNKTMKCEKCKIKEKLKEMEEKAKEKCEECSDPIMEDKYIPHFHLQPITNKDWINNTGCMHDSCTGCRKGTCNGVHMISCPCSRCSPR